MNLALFVLSIGFPYISAGSCGDLLDGCSHERCDNSSYCRSYHAKYTSDEGWDIRCRKCSIFQTCLRSVQNNLDDCNDICISKDIELFHQGTGTFIFLIVMNGISVILFVISCCLCDELGNLKKEAKKAKPKRTNQTVSYVNRAVILNASRVYLEPTPDYEEQFDIASTSASLPMEPVIANSTELSNDDDDYNRISFNNLPSYSSVRIPSTITVHIDKEQLEDEK